MILIAGEALIDMVSDPAQASRFSAHPGGAAYNVACALGLLGAKPGFVCPISQDTLGNLLLERLAECDASAVLPHRVRAPTPLALVTVDENSQPSYSFYREGTADRALAEFAMDNVAPTATTMMHISGFCLNEANDYQHWLTLVKSILKQGALLSVDPNVRANLVTDKDDYLARIHQLMEMAHVVKVSDEDLLYLCPGKDLAKAKQALAAKVPLLIVTLGAKGAEALYQGETVTVPAQKVTKMADTVGSGDCFAGTYLYGLEQAGVTGAEDIHKLSTAQLHEILSLAAKAAAINCERHGCQPPTLAELTNS